MNDDDWRLQVDLDEEGFAHHLGEGLRTAELEHDLESSFHDRLVVSADGGRVFIYAAQRAQAEAAERVVRRIAGEQRWELQTELRRWHPEAEIWEDPDDPLPGTPEAQASEEAIRLAGERRDSAQQGYPEFEVRIHAGSRHAASKLADRLREENLPSEQRWSYLLVGAVDEASAQALAERLRGELPDVSVTVETNPLVLWDNRPGNPFAVFGGLAGS